MPIFFPDRFGPVLSLLHPDRPGSFELGVQLSWKQVQSFAYTMKDSVVRHFLHGELSFVSAKAVFERLNKAAYKDGSVEALHVLAEIVKRHEEPENLVFFTKYFTQRFNALLQDDQDLPTWRQPNGKLRQPALSDLEWSILVSITNDRNSHVLQTHYEGRSKIHKDLLLKAAKYDRDKYVLHLAIGANTEAIVKDIYRLIKYYRPDILIDSDSKESQISVKIGRTKPISQVPEEKEPDLHGDCSDKLTRRLALTSTHSDRLSKLSDYDGVALPSPRRVTVDEVHFPKSPHKPFYPPVCPKL